MFGVEPRLPIEWEQYDITGLKLREREVEVLTASRTILKQESRESSFKPTFEIGSMVLVLKNRLRKRKPSAKKTLRYEGPFIVEQIHPHGIYDLRSELGEARSFHVSRLVKFAPRSFEPLPGK
ncbi:hypothetical protein AYI69_g1519 [Smittium culicis]|uniref:Uncharacterized protein n=1 Tax=Smittium culicis TaxID=133412 RepID=A0A1R1YQ18_9FUNG|nr:hypothetical protein AYI69_g1519 [Smittium culicis]